MPELKRTFLKGRMNQDLDERLLPIGEYFDATNIQVATSEGSDVGAIETILGNTQQLKRNTDGDLWTAGFGLSSPQCIGGTRDTQNNKIYWFVVDSAGKSAILEYDEATSIIAVVIADIRTGDNQVLGFNANNLITGINIIDDMLFFTDNLNEPRKINISTFKASPTNTGSSATITATTTLLSKKTNAQIVFTAEDINVIKKAPMQAAFMQLYASDIITGTLSGTGIDPIICNAFNFSGGVFPVTGSQTLNFTDTILHPVFKNKNIELRATIRNDKGVNEKYIVTANVTAVTSSSLTVTPITIPTDIPNSAVPWSIVIIEPEFIYKREFPRFSYRWKYTDGEYSAIAPFTEPAFIPGVYEYESMEAENEAMINHLRRIELTFPKRLTTFGPPRDVEFVEVLYKSTKSNNIYVIKTAQLKAASTNVIGENPPFAAIASDGEFDKFIINKELDGPLLDSSQLLRLFDAVPKKALAQEIIANRIVYGNYTEGYDEPSDKPTFDLNIVGDDSFPTDTGGAEKSAGLPSVKSDKTYQVGVAFLDDFNRESPVITNNSATLAIGKDKSALANQIAVSVKSAAPSWAKFYKYYIKDNYSTEYNLLLDRFYDAEDGNYWLSFPSAERNKITEKDILVLKKQHGESIPVTLDNEYKVIDIQNSPPESLKLTNLDVLAKALVKPVSSIGVVQAATPKQVRFLGPDRDANEAFFNAANKARGIQFSKPNDGGSSEVNILSKIYKIKSGGVGYDFSASSPHEEYHFLLEEAVNTADQSYLNALSATADRLEIIFHGEDNITKNEYLGRFFVKVEKRASFTQDIIIPSKSDESNVQVIAGTPISAIGGAQSRPPNVVYPSFVEDISADNPLEVSIFVKRKFDALLSAQRLRRSFTDVYQKKKVAQLSFGLGTDTDTSGGSFGGTNPGSSSTDFTLVHGPKSADVNSVKDIYDRAVVGASIRFKDGDNRSDVYTITAIGSEAEKTYSGGQNKYDTKTITLDRNYGGSDIAATRIDGLEILGSSSAQLLTSNPAVFEIKPEKNIDLDIYFEASSAFEIADLNDTKFLDYSNCIAFGNGVESTRIADDFNAPSIGKGVKVSSVLKTDFKEELKGSSMIFSGIVNSRAGVNNSNQFIIAENITKDINPRNGSIQKLYARDGDLLTLCEDKCFQILADKDALFNADGSPQLTASNNVLGQVIPFVGEFGISKNPESFVSYGFRAYFTDKSRGAVLRLSRNGLTEISEQGLSDYFEDKFKATTNPLNGSYDESAGSYNLRVDSEQVSYDEGNQGWCTKLSYQPEFAISLNNNYYSFKSGSMWKHDNTTRANFYGVQGSTDVTVIFNDAPSSIKHYKTVFYEGDSGWTVDLETDVQNGITSGTLDPGLTASLGSNTFKEKEGKYYNFITGDALTWSNALSHSGGTQTGNLDTAEFAIQGIGTMIAGDYSLATVNIAFASDVILPNSLQVNDQFFYVSNSNSKIYKLGKITGVDQSVPSVRVVKQGSDVPAVLPNSGGGDFAFFAKDTIANTSGISGYFNKAKFTNTGTGKNELFAVGTEVFISS